MSLNHMLKHNKNKNSYMEINLDNWDIDFDSIPMSKEEVKAWMKELADRGYSKKEIRSAWLDADIKMISAVSNPSHDSQFVALKSEGDEDEETVVKEGPILKSEKDEEKQIAYAAVMVPEETDKDGDIVPAEVVRSAAHDFMRKKRNDNIDEEHETRTGATSPRIQRGTVVESHVLDERDNRKFETVTGEEKEYPVGTWMAGIEFDDDTWEEIKSGDITGYSIMGSPTAVTFENDKSTETLKGSDELNEDMTDSENENLSVSVGEETLAKSIAEQVQEQIDLEPETEEKEVYPEVEDYFDEKEVATQDLFGLVADHLEVDVADVTDALDPLTGEGETEEETEEEVEESEEGEETEDVEESEETEEETDEKSEETEDEVDRVATEETQKSEETETDQDRFSSMWDGHK